MNRSQKGQPNEQTYFRLSLECRSHPGSADTGHAGSGSQLQDRLFEGQDQQEASQQENRRGYQRQRQARCEVIGINLDFARPERHRSGRCFLAMRLAKI
jgi:hypothetical protein